MDGPVLFNHLFIEEYLSCFQFFAIVNNAVTNFISGSGFYVNITSFFWNKCSIV